MTVLSDAPPVLPDPTDEGAPDAHARRHATRPVVLDSSSQALRDLRLRESTYRRLLALADALTAALAVLVAVEGVGARPLRLLYLLVIPVMILAAKLGGLYDKDELVLDRTTLKELPRLLNVASVVALLVWLLRHYLAAGSANTFHLLMLWALLVGGMVVMRSIARRVALRISPIERCLFVGREPAFERLARKIEIVSGVELVGRTEPEVAINHSALRELLEREQVQRLIVDTDAAGSDVTLDIVRIANTSGLQVSLLPTALGAVGSAVAFDDVGGIVLMGVPRFGLSRSSALLKRSFDLAGASIGLFVLSPVMAAIAVAIKVESHGPVLFNQTRMGRDEIPFQMFKFRSMVDGADALKDSLREHNEAACDDLFKIDADPRTTRVGRLIRRCGLDELPQLFNVLAGSMSLVGPRPLVIDEDRHVTGFDRRRLHLTPGVTGRWQTLGSARIPLEEMVKIDYLYVANWSPWNDLRIIVDTIVYLARGGGQ